jgi:hypothetical protein
MTDLPNNQMRIDRGTRWLLAEVNLHTGTVIIISSARVSAFPLPGVHETRRRDFSGFFCGIA